MNIGSEDDNAVLITSGILNVVDHSCEPNAKLVLSISNNNKVI